MLTHIFIDMDGVLADFISAAMRLHGHKFDPATYPRGEWEIANVVNVTQADFWGEIDRHPNFWADLEPYHWAGDLLAEVADMDCAVRILTTPSLHPHSYRGKREWLTKYHIKHPAILCGSSSDKALLASPDRLLIDDSDKNVELFRAAGGQAILFPQPWNKNHELTADPLGHVIEQLGAVYA